MRFARWITLVWPGLTELWLAGAGWGLAIGCSFAWLVNLAVVSTFVWTELLGPWSRIGVWILLLVVWGFSATLSFRQLWRSNPLEQQATALDLFRRAQREYLTGNWIQAEQLLNRIIQIDRKDVDAQLLLVGLLRRTGQLTEAADQLRRLETIDGAEKWHSEIERERHLLEELLKNPFIADTQHSPATDDRQNSETADRQSPTKHAA